MLSRGDEVIAVCRTASEELQSLKLRVIEGIDVCTDQSISSLQSQLGDEKLDWLINKIQKK